MTQYGRTNTRLERYVVPVRPVPCYRGSSARQVHVPAITWWLAACAGAFLGLALRWIV